MAVVAQQTETQLAIAREERRYQARLAAYTETLSVLKSTTEWEEQVNWWSYGDDSLPTYAACRDLRWSRPRTDR
jgi:hypothetical protein